MHARDVFPLFKKFGGPSKMGGGGPDPTNPLTLDQPLRNVLEEGDIAKCTCMLALPC